MEIVFGEEKWEIPQIAQYETVRHSKLVNCECEYADYSRPESYDIIGYVDTQQGYMIVCECPKCFDKYRHHISTSGRYNFDTFKADLGLKLHLKARKK